MACSVPVSSFQGDVLPSRKIEAISEIERVMIEFPELEMQDVGLYQGNHVMVYFDRRKSRLIVVSQYGRNDLLAKRVSTRLGEALKRLGVELRSVDHLQDTWH